MDVRACVVIVICSRNALHCPLFAGRGAGKVGSNAKKKRKDCYEQGRKELLYQRGTGLNGVEASCSKWDQEEWYYVVVAEYLSLGMGRIDRQCLVCWCRSWKLFKNKTLGGGGDG